MILLENITIAVEPENGIYRAYAYNSDGESIASCKSTRDYGAVAGLFETLRNKANDEVARK